MISAARSKFAADSLLEGSGAGVDDLASGLENAMREAIVSEMQPQSLAVTPGIGCSAKPDAFDPCVPIPGSNGSATNQVSYSRILVTA
jgi:hypothetical protein